MSRGKDSFEAREGRSGHPSQLLVVGRTRWGGNGGGGAVMVNTAAVSGGWYRGGERGVAAAQALDRSEVLFGTVECG
jgi:hypothetical protein